MQLKRLYKRLQKAKTVNTSDLYLDEWLLNDEKLLAIFFRWIILESDEDINKDDDNNNNDNNYNSNNDDDDNNNDNDDDNNKNNNNNNDNDNDDNKNNNNNNNVINVNKQKPKNKFSTNTNDVGYEDSVSNWNGYMTLKTNKTNVSKVQANLLKILNQYSNLYREFSSKNFDYYGITNKKLCLLYKLEHDDKKSIKGKLIIIILHHLSHGAYHVLSVMKNMEIMDYMVNDIGMEWNIVLPAILQAINSSDCNIKVTQLSHGISFGLKYRSELCNKQKLKKLESLLMIPRKEKMVRQSFSLEQVLKTAQRLALAKERDDIVTDLLLAFSIERVKTFSSIEVEEIPQLKVKMGGYLIFKNEIALKPSKLFEDIMERIFRRWNLSLENARRTIVDTYLLEAVDYNYDPKTYDTKEDKLAIYSEYYIKSQNVEKDLILKGSVNYISAKRAEPNNLSLQAGHSLPSYCVFCAIEAKKDESFTQCTGELLGEMKALHKREKKPINSVLTDGLRWIFYHLDDDIYYESKIIYHEYHSNIILGALYYWVRGEIPADNLFKKVNQIN
ncbi:hypothetical protein C1645_812500 [Glomus cerebriforme]|uniref:Uncharacterized protein n=1 Tax=Glomus cerebriforme TaxID=658196 RepID=A0A397TQA5_9GLOM|nr:hypothetical protein C1645_812500 [Glomus cerebriforme]